MAASKATPDTVKQIHYLAAALKAPASPRPPRGSPSRPGTRAGPGEDYLAAVLEREVSARNARRPTAHPSRGFGARKTSRTSTSTPSQPSGSRSPPWPPARS